MPATAPAVLLPREHGTYGEILFPLIAALALGAGGAGAWGLAAMALGGYLAHEGFVVLLGMRGGRARREHARAAWRSVALFGGLAAIGAGVAAPRVGPDTGWGLVLAGLLSAVAIASAWAGRERTLGGEALAAVALPAWSVPAALAAGVPWRLALTAWMVWSVAFVAATCAVQVVIARATRRPHRLALAGCVALATAGPVAAALLTASGATPQGTLRTMLPACLAALAVAALPIPSRRLREIGWSFIAVSVATLALMVGILR